MELNFPKEYSIKVRVPHVEYRHKVTGKIIKQVRHWEVRPDWVDEDGGIYSCSGWVLGIDRRYKPENVECIKTYTDYYIPVHGEVHEV